MLIPFFFKLREGGINTSITELLTLHEAMRSGLAGQSVDNFYFLARTSLVKDEAQLDRFDRIFGAYFKGVDDTLADLVQEIPEEWLRRQAELSLSEEERKLIESMGGFDELMKALQKRLEEQDERHEGGNKWIGTAGTSPFGAYGYNPEGVRIGQQGSRNRSAVKVWDKREFRNLDDSVELGTRNIKVALRRLRKFAREGAADQLDLNDTIDKTARNGGMLDIRMVPERHNAVKILLCLDIGGSMDDHVRICEETFSAARSELPPQSKKSSRSMRLASQSASITPAVSAESLMNSEKTGNSTARSKVISGNSCASFFSEAARGSRVSESSHSPRHP